MRIGMILDTAFPPDSRVENEAVSLVGAGHDVFLFSLNRGNQPERETINGIYVFRYPTSKFEYKSSALAYTLPLYRWSIGKKIDAFLEEVLPDVLHIHDLTVAQTAVHSASRVNIPVVLDLHENRPEIMKEYVHLKKFPGKYLIDPVVWAKWQNRLVRLADRVVVVTEEACQDLVKSADISPAKVVPVPNTVTLSIYDNYPVNREIADKYTGDRVLLYMGDTGLRRGTDTLINAMPEILRHVPNARLVFVGSNTEDSQLVELTRNRGLIDRVSFEGWQDVSLFPSYVAAAAICYSPLKRNRHHDTTFANKIFQYMAGARPLIVSDCPPQARVVRTASCGLVHEAENAAALAECTIKLLGDNAQAEKMGIAGRIAVEKTWNWNLTSAELIRLYDSLAKS